jgi:hypothetical protein
VSAELAAGEMAALPTPRTPAVPASRGEAWALRAHFSAAGETPTLPAPPTPAVRDPRGEAWALRAHFSAVGKARELPTPRPANAATSAPSGLACASGCKRKLCRAPGAQPGEITERGSRACSRAGLASATTPRFREPANPGTRVALSRRIGGDGGKRSHGVSGENGRRGRGDGTPSNGGALSLREGLSLFPSQARSVLEESGSSRWAALGALAARRLLHAKDVRRADRRPGPAW